MILYHTKKNILWSINTELLDTVSRGNTLPSSNKAERPAGEGTTGSRNGRAAWTQSYCSSAALELSLRSAAAPGPERLGALDTPEPGEAGPGAASSAGVEFNSCSAHKCL